jgi:hypothetical protein
MSARKITARHSLTRFPSRVRACAAGITGGFAGGERGVKAFVRDGEVKMRKAGTPGGQPISPLGTAFVVLSAGLVGAIVLAQFSPLVSALRACPIARELE